MKQYRIIYADPPWQYENNGRGAASNHYNTTSLNGLCQMDVPSIAAKDAVLFMWITWPLLVEAMQLIKAWGFKYKTCAFNWYKKNKTNDDLFVGLGHHTRGNSEVCLLAVRGKGVPRMDKTIRQVQIIERAAHSAKPEKFRQDIERLYGITPENSHEFPRLEMFARYPVEGWDVFGNEAPESISIPLKAPTP